jgi:two-component system sensor histidine kinase BaeS
MLRSLRSRLILSHILPIFIIIPLMGILLIYVLERNFIIPSLTRELVNSADILVRLTNRQTQIWTDPIKAQEFLGQNDNDRSERVMFLSQDAHLMASSDPRDSHRISKLITIPGFSQALAGQVVQRVDYSSSFQSDIIEVLVPVKDSTGKVLGVIRMSYRFTTALEQLLQVRYLIAGILLFGLLFGTILGIILAININSPIRRVTEAVYDLASGNRQGKLEEVGAEEITLLLRAVNHLVDRLHQLEHARKQLLANLVHELGRPMGALRAAIYAIKKGAKQDPQLLDELLNGMDGELVLLQHLLNDLSQLHDQVLGSLELKRESIDLSQWLPEVSTHWREAAIQKGIEWKTMIPQTLPAIYADPFRLAQILGNLISNAIRYTPKSGTITISCGLKGDQIYIRVQDNGPGISLEDQKRIFTPFYRGQQSRRFKQGMGLGLGIAKTLVMAHQGQLEIDSMPGHGSTFTVSLPLHTSEHLN